MITRCHTALAFAIIIFISGAPNTINFNTFYAEEEMFQENLDNVIVAKDLYYSITSLSVAMLSTL